LQSIGFRADQIAAYQQVLADRAANGGMRAAPNDPSAAGRASGLVRRAKADARKATAATTGPSTPPTTKPAISATVTPAVRRGRRA
jgi:hypothetical protein